MSEERMSMSPVMRMDELRPDVADYERNIQDQINTLIANAGEVSMDGFLDSQEIELLREMNVLVSELDRVLETGEGLETENVLEIDQGEVNSGFMMEGGKIIMQTGGRKRGTRMQGGKIS